MSELPEAEYGPSAARAAVWAELATAARLARGKWVRLDEVIGKGNAHHVGTGKLSAFLPAGDYEGVMRDIGKVKPNKGILYVRYLGTPAAVAVVAPDGV